ncbi:MAG TPA: hypothetical protein PKE45_07815, partial [Caldilineaceae bacterium]|nr:hypothetical protein [Caldilineaceae bacterium]
QADSTVGRLDNPCGPAPSLVSFTTPSLTKAHQSKVQQSQKFNKYRDQKKAEHISATNDYSKSLERSPNSRDKVTR